MLLINKKKSEIRLAETYVTLIIPHYKSHVSIQVTNFKNKIMNAIFLPSRH